MLYYFFGVNLLQKLLYIIKKYLIYFFWPVDIFVLFCINSSKIYYNLFLVFYLHCVKNVYTKKVLLESGFWRRKKMSQRIFFCKSNVTS